VLKRNTMEMRTRGKMIYRVSEVVREGPTNHSALERGLVVKKGCILKRGDTIILDTSWLCVPCLPSPSWLNIIRTGVNKLDEYEKLAFVRLQRSNTTRLTVSRRRCVIERSENKFTNNAWTMNETDKTGAINERMAVGLHEI